MARLYANGARTRLSGGITNSATSFSVASGTGSLFPSPSGGDYALITLASTTSTTAEIVKCTARSGDTFTVVRAQEGTSAAAFLANDIVDLRITAGTLLDLDRQGRWRYVIEPGLKPPATAATGDDEFDAANGTALSGWTNFSNGGATQYQGAGKLYLTSTGTWWQGVGKATPGSGDFDATTRATFGGYANPIGAGILAIWGTLSAPTKIRLIRYVYTSSAFVIASAYSDFSTWNSNPGSSGTVGGQGVYLRLKYTASGTSLDSQFAVVSPSPNGDGWETLATENVSSRPDYIGLGVSQESTGTTARASFDFIRFNWTPDFDPSV
jgi:hypothetical protein